LNPFKENTRILIKEENQLILVTRFNDSPSPVCFNVGEVRGGDSFERSSSFSPK
jgi:hypothetical protein